MPYKLKNNCVYKKNTGKKVGCSKNRAAAKRYLAKLHMVVKDSYKETVSNIILENVVDEYYISLNEYLLPKFQLGENKHTDTGIINKDEVGIYDVDRNQQIGKLKRTIKNNTLILEHIKIYAEYRGSGVVKKIYEFDEVFARKHNLKVKGNLVNSITRDLFKKIYGLWDISNKGDIYLATQ